MKFAALIRPSGASRAADKQIGRRLTRLAEHLELGGFDAIGFSDHPALPRTGQSGAFDPFVALSACASVTSTVRLVTYALVLPYRSARLTAHSVATLDLLSSGRVTLVVGAGYLAAEFEALGVGYADRGAVFGDRLRDLEEALTVPLGAPSPVQFPVPIFVAGNSDRAARVVAERGLGWAPFISSPSLARRAGTPCIQSPQELARRLDRIEKSSGSSNDPEVMANLPAIGLADDPSAARLALAVWARAGVRWAVVGVDLDGPESELLRSVDRYACGVIDAHRLAAGDGPIVSPRLSPRRRREDGS